MKKQMILILSAGVLVMFISMAGFVTGNQAVEPPEHEFIGAAKCGICHKTAKQGEQLVLWQDSKHAKAFEVLGTKQAREIAAERGIDDPQQSGECLKCHSTAYWFSHEQVSDKIEVAEGVSCESCHGPGKDYMKKSIMQDREASMAHGLIIPTEHTCRQCHNEESPNFQGFDFKEYWEKIKHPIPE